MTVDDASDDDDDVDTAADDDDTDDDNRNDALLRCVHSFARPSIIIAVIAIRMFQIIICCRC